MLPDLKVLSIFSIMEFVFEWSFRIDLSRAVYLPMVARHRRGNIARKTKKFFVAFPAVIIRLHSFSSTGN